MSYQYDLYLKEHKNNVAKGLAWLRKHLPNILDDTIDYEWHLSFAHDSSKHTPEEYEAYDAYFYGNNKSYDVIQEFNKAWLSHIHHNPHHWQHWILHKDDPGEGILVLEMPDLYIIEMICDWWSFSWKAGDLFGIFKWYDERKEHIKLNIKTRQKVEDILNQMREKLEGLKNE